MKRLLLLIFGLLLFLSVKTAYSADTITLSKYSLSFSADSSSITLLATLTDAAGLAVSDTTLNYKIVPDTLLTVSHNASTDADGIDTFTITPDTKVGSGYLIILNSDSTISETATITISPAAPAKMELSLDTTAIVAGENAGFVITVGMYDTYLNPVSAAYRATVNGKAETAASVINGTDTFSFDTTTAGSYNIVCTDTANASVTANTTVTVVHGTPSVLNVKLDATGISIGSKTNIYATLTDAYGNPISGEQINFSANSSYISFDTAYPVTNDTGSVTNVLNAGTKKGSYKVTVAPADYSGLKKDTTVTLLPLHEYYATILPKSGYVEPNSTTQLSVLVTDTYGNPAGNIPLYIGVHSDNSETYGIVKPYASSTIETSVVADTIKNNVYGTTNDKGYLYAYYKANGISAIGDEDWIYLSKVTSDTINYSPVKYTLKIGHLAKIDFLSDTLVYMGKNKMLRLELGLYDSSHNLISDISDSKVKFTVNRGNGYLYKTSDTTVKAAALTAAADSGHIILYYKTSDTVERSIIKAELNTLAETISIYTVEDTAQPTITPYLDFSGNDFVSSSPHFRFVLEDTITGINIPSIKVKLNNTDITDSSSVKIYIPSASSVSSAPKFPQSDSSAVLQISSYDTPQLFSKVVYIDYNQTTALSDGAYTLSISAADNAGNTAADFTLPFYIKNSPEIRDIVNCPNPFSDYTYITYNLSSNSITDIYAEIYDEAFRFLQKVAGTKNVGYNQVYVNTAAFGNGLYLYRIVYVAGGKTARSKLYKMVRNK